MISKKIKPALHNQAKDIKAPDHLWEEIEKRIVDKPDSSPNITKSEHRFGFRYHPKFAVIGAIACMLVLYIGSGFLFRVAGDPRTPIPVENINPIPNTPMVKGIDQYILTNIPDDLELVEQKRIGVNQGFLRRYFSKNNESIRSLELRVLVKASVTDLQNNDNLLFNKFVETNPKFMLKSYNSINVVVEEQAIAVNFYGYKSNGIEFVYAMGENDLIKIESLSSGLTYNEMRNSLSSISKTSKPLIDTHTDAQIIEILTDNFKEEKPMTIEKAIEILDKYNLQYQIVYLKENTNQVLYVAGLEVYDQKVYLHVTGHNQNKD